LENARAIIPTLLARRPSTHFAETTFFFFPAAALSAAALTAADGLVPKSSLSSARSLSSTLAAMPASPETVDMRLLNTLFSCLSFPIVDQCTLRSATDCRRLAAGLRPVAVDSSEAARVRALPPLAAGLGGGAGRTPSFTNSSTVASATSSARILLAMACRFTPSLRGLKYLAYSGSASRAEYLRGAGELGVVVVVVVV